MKFTYMVIILLNILLNINGKDNALRNIKYITMEGQAQFRQFKNLKEQDKRQENS